MKKSVYAIICVLASLAAAPPCSALSLGQNITFFDGNYRPTSSNAWWNTMNEDQEVEPLMMYSQAWDLEGFFINKNILGIVGGFDFKNGVSAYPHYTSGDIFISIDNDYGKPRNPQSNYPSEGFQLLNDNFGYEFALALDFSSNTYTVYELPDDVMVKTVYYSLNKRTNPSSDPWKYVSGGALISEGNPFGYIGNLPDEAVGFAGGTHYVISGFDLSFLTTLPNVNQDTMFTFHFTMGCGNDNLMGQTFISHAPEPATLFLFGTGLIGLAGFARKKII